MKKLFAPKYLLFARRVALTHSRYAPVAQVIRDITSMSQEVAKLNRYKLNVCPFLLRWRHGGWKPSLGFLLPKWAYERAAVDLARVDRIDRDARSTFDALQKLGLSFDEALKLRFTAVYLP